MDSSTSAGDHPALSKPPGQHLLFGFPGTTCIKYFSSKLLRETIKLPGGGVPLSFLHPSHGFTWLSHFLSQNCHDMFHRGLKITNIFLCLLFVCVLISPFYFVFYCIFLFQYIETFSKDQLSVVLISSFPLFHSCLSLDSFPLASSDSICHSILS